MMDRKELIDQINDAGRKMSAITVIFHQTVAEKAGLSGTDHKYLDILFREGAMTAGRLAEITNLTTGAVTGIIDRLEKKNLVKRDRGLEDRRKVLIIPQYEEAMKTLGPIFNELGKDLEVFFEDYTLDELKIILKYLHHTNNFFEHKTEKLKKS